VKVIWVVFSKEFIDIIRDRRRFIWMIVSTLFIFPMLFVAPYAYFITRVAKQTVDDLTIPVQGIENAPALIEYLAKEADIKAIRADDVEVLVRDKRYVVGLVIPADFEEKIANGESVEVAVVSDARRSMDMTAIRLNLALNDYAEIILAARLEQRGLSEEFLAPLTVTSQNVATVTETTGSMLGLLIPGMIISLGLSSGMPIAISTIAGEKKKLTLEPVLFTTVSRLKLVFAKLLAVLASVILTLFTMAASTGISILILILVLLRSLPLDKLAKTATETTTTPASSTPATELLTGGYNIQPLAIILFLAAPFLIILFGAALQILVSSWARNDEEASTYLTPLSLFSGLIIFVAFFLDDFTPRLWHYALPVFGTILSMRDLLSNIVEPASLTVMFLSSAFYAALMIALTVWMFNREEVVFRT
jgi:sodium transport system permease protein